MAKLSSLPLTDVMMGAPKGQGEKIGEVLGGMPKLIELDFATPTAEDMDAALIGIGRSPKLEHLSLTGPLRDAHLKRLMQLSTLRRLSLGKRELTEDGVKQLSNALPKCQIKWDGRTIGPAEPVKK